MRLSTCGGEYAVGWYLVDHLDDPNNLAVGDDGHTEDASGGVAGGLVNRPVTTHTQTG